MPLFCPFHANITFCKINAVTSLSLVIRSLSHSITNCALISFFNALSRTKHFRQKRLLRALRFLFRISCFYYIKAQHLNKIFGMAFVLNITSIKKSLFIKANGVNLRKFRLAPFFVLYKEMFSYSLFINYLCS